jgi:hypothetical protein
MAEKQLTKEQCSEMYIKLFKKYKIDLDRIQEAIHLDVMLHGYITPVTAAKQKALIDRIKKENI